MYLRFSYQDMIIKKIGITSRFILLVLLISNGMKVFSQDDLNITPLQMKEDVDFYFKILHENHPNPYYYYSSMEFESMKNNIYSRIKKPLSYDQFAWIIGEINAYVDGHSLLDFYQCMDKRNLFNGLNKNNRVFPNIRIRNDRVFLKESNLEVKEINGINVTQLIQEESKYFNWHLPYELNIHKMEEFFALFIDSKYDITSPFKVKLSGKNEIENIEGYTIEHYLRNSANGIRGWTIEHQYPYRIYPFSSVAIFCMSNFLIQNKTLLTKDLSDFIKAVNDYKIENVFYDLTKNEGGNFDVFYSAIKALDVINHGTITWRYSKLLKNKEKKGCQIKEVVLNSNFNPNIPKGRKLFVLQGINTLSTGDYFCRIVAENKLGVLVGQNTGEPSIGFSCIQRNYVTPHSRIPFTVATALLDFSKYFSTETLCPDIYWDVNHNYEFTEKELVKIVEQCKLIEY